MTKDVLRVVTVHRAHLLGQTLILHDDQMKPFQRHFIKMIY